MKRFAYLYAIFAFSILFISCFNEQNSGTFLVFSSNARAANASVENLTNITLKGESSDGDKLEYFWESYEPFISSRIELNPGLWDFTLRAFIEEVEYEANVQAEIQAERENHVKFILKALSSESGEGESVSEPESVNEPEEKANGSGDEETPEETPEEVLSNAIYVSSEGSSGNSGRSSDNSLDSIASALSKIEEAENPTDWAIYINGTISGTNTIEISSNSASSLTITGVTGSGTDVLNGNEEGTVLSISTSVPVIIKNLKITGGKTSGSGGGLNIGSSASVTLAGGAVIAGNTASSGGGVYNEGKLFMYGSAVIGDANATSVATSSNYANKASENGAGIYSPSGSIYLGYSNESTKTPLSGGIYYNYSSGSSYSSGAGICGENGSYIYMDSGNISYNTIDNRMGGGIAFYGTFTMSGGSISYNKTAVVDGTESGGGIRVGGTFTMSNGSINNNSAESTGAGVCVASNGSFTMTGGIIKDNESTSDANIHIERDSPPITIGETSVTSDNISAYNTNGIEL